MPDHFYQGCTAALFLVMFVNFSLCVCVCTGMKKPPVAPKPRLLPPQKPAPPPIAPKPEVLLSTPSPSAIKRGKPAVAPKPCLPKISPKAPQKPPPSLSHSPSQTGQNLIKNQTLSKNGGSPIPTSRLSRYIIPPFSESHQVGNGKSGGSEERSGTAKDDSLKGRDSPTLEVSHNSTKDQVISPHQEVELHTPNNPHIHEETHTLALIKDHIQAHPPTPTCVESLTPTDESVQIQDQPVEQRQSAALHKPCSSVNSVHSEVNVPAPPSKPLPVPQPRRPRRTLLLRQNVVEGSPPGTPTQTLQDFQTDTIHKSPEDASPDIPPESPHSKEYEENPPYCIDTGNSIDSIHHTGSTHSIDPTHITDSTQNSDSSVRMHSGSSDVQPELTRHSDPVSSKALFATAEEEEELKPPAPPPRQKSLPQKGHFTSCSLDNLILSAHTDSGNTAENFSKEQEDDDDDDDKDGAYGNFARYPITRSLPKQIKLGCGPRVTVITKASSEEERSPKVVPKKPQRHSLPASALLRKQNTPPQTQNSVPSPDPSLAVFGELPAPPNEKPSPWRITFSGIPLFGKQQPNRSSSQPQASGARPFLIKQRAKSFSSADLLRVDSASSPGSSEQLVRSEQRRRSLRKLLELRACVRLLPKLLRSGQSLDCTSSSVESDDRTNTSANCEVKQGEVIQNDDDSDCGVEYENVPLYDEIPEYMNLPWVYSNQNEDTGIYEVQEPYEMHR